MQKVVANQELTEHERRTLKRHEKDKDERLRWHHYRSIPAKHWKAMSGRQAKVINEQAQRYGLPFGGAVINLPQLARALHDFLAENAVKLGRDDDALLSGPVSPALERFREERAHLARLDRLERQHALVPRRAARLGMSLVAAMLRAGLESLGRQFGHEASDLMLECIADAEAELERCFGAQAAASFEAADDVPSDVPVVEEAPDDDGSEAEGDLPASGSL